jgi:hypothetical protein
MSPRVGLQAHIVIADSTKADPGRNPTRNYAAVAISGPSHIATSSKVSAE